MEVKQKQSIFAPGHWNQNESDMIDCMLYRGVGEWDALGGLLFKGEWFQHARHKILHLYLETFQIFSP